MQEGAPIHYKLVYKCPQCKISSKSLDELYSGCNKLAPHCFIKMAECPRCSKVFEDSEALFAHLVADHEAPVKPFKCGYCPSVFYFMDNCMEHRNSCELNPNNGKE